MHRAGHKYSQIGVGRGRVRWGEGAALSALANGVLTAHHNHNEQQQQPCHAAAVRHMECHDGHDDDDRNNKRKCSKPSRVPFPPPPLPSPATALGRVCTGRDGVELRSLLFLVASVVWSVWSVSLRWQQ